MTMSAAKLTANNLKKRYKARTVVEDVSFEVKSGEVVGLLGPNGAGKTTTLRLCLGLTAPASGAIALNGRAIPTEAQQARARVGVVP